LSTAAFKAALSGKQYWVELAVVGLDVVGVSLGVSVVGVDVVGLDVVGMDVVGIIVGLDVVSMDVVGLDVVGMGVVGLDVVGMGDLVDLPLAGPFGDLVALAAFTAVGLLLVFDDFGALACAKLNIKIARMASSLVKFFIVPVWVGERDGEGGVRTVKNRITTFICLK
jgi:hypothetical protein